jgi:hypothetical protein
MQPIVPDCAPFDDGLVLLPERRTSKRFPIQSEIRYRMLESGRHIPQTDGKMIDMSSRGVRISAAQALPCGKRVEVSINWPVALNATCRLKLMVTGEVVRSDADETVVAILKHEFRTNGMCPPV